ncbi:MAG TPA: hypothetical protein VGE51_04395 [Fontimonas sp.]
MNKTSNLLLVLIAALIAMPAQAYVGPGAGLSLLGSLWAVVVAVFAALFFVVMWPLRRMMKRRQAARGDAASEPATAGHSGVSK